MLTRTQALEGGANVTCISKVQFTYHIFIRLTVLGYYATIVAGKNMATIPIGVARTRKRLFAKLNSRIACHAAPCSYTSWLQ
jgi:hypothetical protein